MTDNTVIRREVVVPAPVERAFATFVERFDEIKPHEQNLLDAPISRTEFQPREGGAIVDIGTDGSECRWARVLVYEPPSRLVFSWDIGPTWQLETDLRNASEVEVRFIAESPDRTRVELEHRHLDRHGDGWPSLADGVADTDGWPLWFDRYRALLTAAA